MYFTGSLPLPPFMLGLVLFITVLIFSLVLFEGRSVVQKIPSISILILFFIFPPFLLFVLSYFIRPIFVPRGFLFSSVAFYGACGIVIAHLRSKQKRAFIMLLFITSAIISLLYQIPYNTFPRSPYRECLNYLKQKAQGDTIVVHDNKLSYFPMYYFDRAMNQVFIKDKPGTINDTLALDTQSVLGVHPIEMVSDIAGGYEEVFYILFLRGEQEYQKADVKNLNLSWLEENCVKQDSAHVNDLGIRQYECNK
jgi:mannosyltransferase